MLHRIRLAMQTKSFLLSGEVEVDETFIGGKARNMHRSVREGMSKGGGSIDKTPVLGMVERGGKVRAEVIPNTKGDTIRDHAVVTSAATLGELREQIEGEFQEVEILQVATDPHAACFF
jgi:hypothetical protein